MFILYWDLPTPDELNSVEKLTINSVMYYGPQLVFFHFSAQTEFEEKSIVFGPKIGSLQNCVFYTFWDSSSIWTDKIC